jgi:chromosome partitioning protein
MAKTSQLPAVDRTVPLEQISEFAEKVSIFTDELRDTVQDWRNRRDV